MPGFRPLLLAALLAAAPSPAWAQAGDPGSDGPRGWSVGVDWAWSFEQSPLGSYFGDATQWVGVRFETPEIRGRRPTMHVARVDARGECFIDAPCDEYRAWTFRAGILSGDLDPDDGSRVAPFALAEVGAFHSDYGTTFSPAVRAGVLIDALPRVAPRLEVGLARVPWNGWLWEMGAGLRVTLF
jgi:hypothetical protein